MLDQKIICQIIDSMEGQGVLSRLRREFHKIPELGMEEYKTTEMIRTYLQGIGVTPTLLEPTGLIAYIGPEDAYTIALRADIDGLLVEEQNEVSYCSIHEGQMHACGHDGHIAGLLGAAAVLKALEGSLIVRVKLIFQPSEENASGAKHILKQDILSDVDEIFGLHLFSDLKTGVVSVEEGPRMAQTDRFAITFHGRGGHAGKPHQCVDATVMAADFVMSAQTIVSRELDPVDSAVVTIGAFHSGTQYNIIAGEAKLEGTCRSFSLEVGRQLKDAIEQRAKAISAYYGGRVTIDYDFASHPPVLNDSAMAGRVAKSAEVMLGAGHLTHVPQMMLGEDFSWYQTIVPGVFAFVGCGNEEKGITYPNHHPSFEIDEDALAIAVKAHISAVMSAEGNCKNP